EVGRSRWEIDAAGIRGMLAHFAKEKNAIGATQRPHAEAVEYRWVRKAPVAPCQEAREIGIEIAGAEALCGEYGIAPEQDAAVPEIGRAPSELQSLAYLVCRLLLEKKKSR